MRRNINKKRKVAAFDIDGTIFRSSLLIELVNQLIADGAFPKSVRREYEKQYSRWLDRADSYEKYIWGVIRAFDGYSKKIHEKDMLRAVKKVQALHKNRVYRFTRDLVSSLKKKGYYLLAISHSPKYIVDGFAKRMGFNKVYGRFLELDANGRFTGETLHKELISDKAKILQRAAEKENLTLHNSVGVGDTESDISFLSIVSQPICFNPNEMLYKAAKKRGWRVVVERKDMIYEIEKRKNSQSSRR